MLHTPPAGPPPRTPSPRLTICAPFIGGTARRAPGPVRTLVVAAGRLFSGSYDRTVRAWDVNALSCLGVLEGHKDAVRALATANGFIFSGSDDTTVRAVPAPLRLHPPLRLLSPVRQPGRLRRPTPAGSSA